MSNHLYLCFSVQNWPGLGHKYFSLHRSWEGRKYSLNLLLFRWKGSKKKLLVGRILWRRRDVWHNKIISILAPGVLSCSRDWDRALYRSMKKGEKGFDEKICWCDVVCVWSRDDNHIVWCQMRCGQKPLLIQKYYLSIITDVFGLSLSSIFNFLCWQNITTILTLLFARFCKTNLNFIKATI